MNNSEMVVRIDKSALRTGLYFMPFLISMPLFLCLIFNYFFKKLLGYYISFVFNSFFILISAMFLIGLIWTIITLMSGDDIFAILNKDGIWLQRNGFIFMARKPQGFLSLGMNGHHMHEHSKR